MIVMVDCLCGLFGDKVKVYIGEGIFVMLL